MGGREGGKGVGPFAGPRMGGGTAEEGLHLSLVPLPTAQRGHRVRLGRGI